VSQHGYGCCFLVRPDKMVPRRLIGVCPRAPGFDCDLPAESSAQGWAAKSELEKREPTFSIRRLKGFAYPTL
jgi:hypothetical protein